MTSAKECIRLVVRSLAATCHTREVYVYKLKKTCVASNGLKKRSPLPYIPPACDRPPTVTGGHVFLYLWLPLDIITKIQTITAWARRILFGVRWRGRYK